MMDSLVGVELLGLAFCERRPDDTADGDDRTSDNLNVARCDETLRYKATASSGERVTDKTREN
jgi:hypothetical protein